MRVILLAVSDVIFLLPLIEVGRVQKVTIHRRKLLRFTYRMDFNLRDMVMISGGNIQTTRGDR